MFFDAGKLKVLSPLLSDTHLTEVAELEVVPIFEAGRDWQDSFHDDAAARKAKAGSSPAIRKLVANHEDWYNSMVQKCFATALSMACCAEDRTFVSPDGKLSPQNVSAGLEVGSS